MRSVAAFTRPLNCTQSSPALLPLPLFFPLKEAAPWDVIEIDLSSFLRAFGIWATGQAWLLVALQGF